MEPWIIATLVAAAAQTARFALQRHLKRTGLSVAGATFSRFVFSAPLVALGVVTGAWLARVPLPVPPPNFWAFALPGGIAQILATACVIAMFSLRNFAVGIAFKKSEAVLTGVVGIVVLGETLSLGAWIAIGIGVLALLLLSQEDARGWSWGALLSRATALGLGSGLLFSFSAVLYRGATLQIPELPVLLRAGLTLACVTAWQTCVLGAWLAFRERGELTRVARHWRVAALVGVTSLVGSYGWFTAFALQSAALVKALGQVEVILSILVTTLVLGERMRAREGWAIAGLTASILLLIWVG
ncbi:DMT family transporter [Palleronia pelagia]|uniref:EamA-like transporter family protein n=1 Tax=Palleronia pelagia TaxID=387096 RepID=A0A1H8IIC6_9RHOB|nr:DMT family transporter [Palleronia pelagia]SEN68022.1 hypothetical protein SAMN04488011_105236 [Palleronia pelagia]